METGFTQRTEIVNVLAPEKELPCYRGIRHLAPELQSYDIFVTSNGTPNAVINAGEEEGDA